MRNAPDTEFKVHSLLLLFSRTFYVYPLLFRSLQYIYESLHRRYPSVCLCRLQRQSESYSLSCSDHASNLSLLIRFQHKSGRKKSPGPILSEGQPNYKSARDWGWNAWCDWLDTCNYLYIGANLSRLTHSYLSWTSPLCQVLLDRHFPTLNPRIGASGMVRIRWAY